MEIWVTYEQSSKNTNALHMSLQVLIGRYHFIHLPLPSYFPALLRSSPLSPTKLFNKTLKSPSPYAVINALATYLLTTDSYSSKSLNDVCKFLRMDRRVRELRKSSGDQV